MKHRGGKRDADGDARDPGRYLRERGTCEAALDVIFAERLRDALRELSPQQRRAFDARLRASTKHIATSKR